MKDKICITPRNIPYGPELKKLPVIVLYELKEFNKLKYCNMPNNDWGIPNEIMVIKIIESLFIKIP